MKAKLYTSMAVVLFIANALYSQVIPNGGFETWGLYNTWNYTPESWNTSNNQLSELVTIDSMSYEGELALNIVGEVFGTGAFAETGIPINAIPDRLGFYVKTFIDGFPYFSVTSTVYNNGVEVTSEIWVASETLDEWTYQELDFDNIEPVVDSIAIRIEAVFGDFVMADGWMSVDAFEFLDFVSVDEQNEEIITLYPNPATEQMFIKGEMKSNQPIHIYDLNGRLVKTSVYYNSIDVSELSAGLYFLEMTDRKGIVRRLRWCKE